MKPHGICGICEICGRFCVLVKLEFFCRLNVSYAKNNYVNYENFFPYYLL